MDVMLLEFVLNLELIAQVRFFRASLFDALEIKNILYEQKIHFHSIELNFCCLGEEAVCEKKYNGYYSYGDCGEMDDVHSFEECCELTKEAQLLQPDRGITRFSYNGHKYVC